MKRLLIVDDSEIDREILKIILSKKYDVIEAYNGYSALEIMLDKTIHIDAVVLDILMPTLDGFDVLKIMDKNGVENLPVILITSEATKDNVQKAVKYNIHYFISKPFDNEVIYRKLEELFESEK